MTRALSLDIGLLVRLGVCPDDEALRAVYEGALAADDLDAADFLTARDLLALCAVPGAGGHDAALHALLLALFRERARGSTCLDLDADSLARALGFAGNEETVAAMVKRVPELVASDGMERITAYADGFAGEPAWRPLVCVREEGRCRTLAFQKLDAADRRLARAIAERLSGCPAVPADSVNGAWRKIVENTDGFPLHEDQRLALALALVRRFCVITGGPGTGKTTIVASLVRLLVELGVAKEDIRLAAPTGRAAKRMSESLDTAAVTLHRLLAYSPSRHAFDHDAENPLPARVVIVDEASMVDAYLMTRLVEAACKCERLILIGDHDQLPSVEAGAVLSALVAGDRDARQAARTRDAVLQLLRDTDGELAQRVERGAVGGYSVRLGHTHRYDSVIAEAARHVNALEADALLARLVEQGRVIGINDGLENCRDGVWFVRLDEAYSAKAMDGLVETWGRAHLLQTDAGATVAELAGTPVDPGSPDTDHLSRVFRWLQRSRVLTATHAGHAGRIAANRVLGGLLAVGGGYRAAMDPVAGTPVMISRNDYGRGLFNGDVGVVLNTADGQRRVFFDQVDGPVSFALGELADWTPAFAMTVHKSQGSEFDSVLVLLPEEADHPMLTCEILYTALTRAKKLVVIAGPEAALRRAATTRIRRNSNLARALAAMAAEAAVAPAPKN